MAKNSISPYIKMEDISNKILSHKEKGEINDSICLFYFMFASKLVAPMEEKNQFFRVADTVIIATNKVIESYFGLSRRKRESVIKTLEKLNFIKVHKTEGGANAYEFLVGVYFGQKENSRGIPKDFKIQFGHHELTYPSLNEEDKEIKAPEAQEEQNSGATSSIPCDIVITPVERIKAVDDQGGCTESSVKVVRDHARVYNSLSFNKKQTTTTTSVVVFPFKLSKHSPFSELSIEAWDTLKRKFEPEMIQDYVTELEKRYRSDDDPDETKRLIDTDAGGLLYNSLNFKWTFKDKIQKKEKIQTQNTQDLSVSLQAFEDLYERETGER